MWVDSVRWSAPATVRWYWQRAGCHQPSWSRTTIGGTLNVLMAARESHPDRSAQVFNIGNRYRDRGEPPCRDNRAGPRDVDNIRRRVVNIEEIRRMLRWSPQFTLERGLEQTAAWIAGQSIPGRDEGVTRRA